MSKRKKNHPHDQTAQSHPAPKIRFWHKHPDWTAMGVLLVLLLIFFNPIVFSNKTLMPPDKIASMSFMNFVPQTLPSVFKNHNYPLWNPYLFSGMPSFASLTMPFVDVVNDAVILTAGGIQYLISWIHPVDLKTPFYYLCNYLLLGGFIFLLLRTRKLSVPASLFAAAAMMFIPQVVVYAAFGHHTKLATVVLIPLVFLLVERLLEKQNLLFFSLTGLALGVQFLRAHVQISYYTHLVIGLYFLCWIIWSIRDKEKAAKVVKGGLLLLGAVLMGVLISSWMNLSVWEYSRYSIRGGEAGGVGYDYATGWSFPPSEIATFFVPAFMGFGGQTYWGSMPFTDFPMYFGILVFILAGLALVFNRNRTVWFFALLAGLSLLASFGKHLPVLYWPMYKILPFFNKFRAPNMIHILLEFSMVILAAYGFQAVLNFSEQAGKEKLKQAKRFLWGFGGVLVLLFLVLLFGKGAYLNWAQKAGENRLAAYDSAMSDALKSMVMVVAAVLIILSTLRKKIGAGGFTVLMVGLLIADLWMVDHRFITFQPKADEKAYFAETPEVRFLKEQKGQFRILPVEDGRAPNWYMYHLLQSVYGYHAAKVKIYQDLLDAFRMPNAYLMKYLKVVDQRYALKEPNEVSAAEIKTQDAFLKLLNVRYVLCPYSLPDASLKLAVPPQAEGLPAVFEYSGFLPRTFFPKQVVQMQGKDAILGVMAGGSFDPANTAIIEEPPPFTVSASDSNKANIVSWGIHRIEIKAKTKTPALLALSEIYYPAGWKAFVDGREAKIYKTDYVIRSVFLEPGDHTIEMVFKPRLFKIGLMVTLASFGILIAGAIAGFRLNRKKKIAQPEVPVQ